jgi:hypothetical protein
MKTLADLKHAKEGCDGQFSAVTRTGIPGVGVDRILLNCPKCNSSQELFGQDARDIDATLTKVNAVDPKSTAAVN